MGLIFRSNLILYVRLILFEPTLFRIFKFICSLVVNVVLKTILPNQIGKPIGFNSMENL